MSLRTLICAFFFLLLPLLCFGVPRLVDLSYTYDTKTPNHPKLSKFDLRVVKRGLNKYGVWVELNDFFSSEHSGTHVDAPVHFAKNAKTIDQIMPADFYRVPGVMLDLRSRVIRSENYEITAEDLQEWVNNHGEFPDGAVLLIMTGWGRKAFNPAAYSGMDQFGKLNFPSLGKDAAEWIVSYKNRTRQRRGIVGVGLDVMSLDVGQSSRMPAHVTLLGAGIYGLENVANLDKLPLRGFTLSIFPIKIGNGSGGPARVIAEIEGTPYASPLMSGTTKLERKFHLNLIYSLAVVILSAKIFS